MHYEMFNCICEGAWVAQLSQGYELPTWLTRFPKQILNGDAPDKIGRQPEFGWQ
jgi:hypothetical protein